MEETPREFNPDQPRPDGQLDPIDDIEATHELLNAAADLEEGEQDVEARRKEYEAAKDKMTSRIRELRSSLKFRLERIKDEDERRELIADEAASLASSFSHSEQMAILKKLLPNRAHADTAKEKFSLIVELGLDLPYWSTDNFLHAYSRKFGRGAERSLNAEAEELHEAFLREYPELEELDQAA